MVLFTVNSVDFTDYVSQRTYTMQRTDYFSTWEDGNWVTHRAITRQKVKGSFTMGFPNEASYNAFKAAVDAVKVDGYCPVTVYVQNEKQTRQINAFVDFSTKIVWTQVGTPAPALASVTVSVNER